MSDKMLQITIKAHFVVGPDGFDGFDVIAEALEKLRETGAATVVDVVVLDKRAGKAA